MGLQAAKPDVLQSTVCITPLLQNVSLVPTQVALKLFGSQSLPAAQPNALLPDAGEAAEVEARRSPSATPARRSS